jgi:1,2-diacylglycerol 3-beta-galactosyltransferase
MDYSEEQIFRASGMILHPKFYAPIKANRAKERVKLGLEPEVPVGLVLFGGHGSADMEAIAKRLGQSERRMQLIMLCGHNQKLADRLREMSVGLRMHVEGFTQEVPYFMYLSDLFIGKPGPGSISEALAMQLPVIVERNAWTLPQERYNADWIQEQGLGRVLSSFREIGPAVEEMLRPHNYARLRKRAKAHRNRAVFEIPDFMELVMARVEEASSIEPLRVL